MAPAERAAEKLRIQREQEEADLALAMEAFGTYRLEGHILV